jgi:hypothetical protein
LLRPRPITITASAADSDGAVTSVTFFVNGAPLGSDPSSPYSFAWNNVVPGTYTLDGVGNRQFGRDIDVECGAGDGDGAAAP